MLCAYIYRFSYFPYAASAAVFGGGQSGDFMKDCAEIIRRIESAALGDGFDGELGFVQQP